MVPNMLTSKCEQSLENLKATQNGSTRMERRQLDLWTFKTGSVMIRQLHKSAECTVSASTVKNLHGYGPHVKDVKTSTCEGLPVPPSCSCPQWTAECQCNTRWQAKDTNHGGSILLWRALSFSSLLRSAVGRTLDQITSV